jgi:hypothetical protein
MSWTDWQFLLEKYNGNLRHASNTELQAARSWNPDGAGLRLAKAKYASGERMYDFDLPKKGVSDEVTARKEDEEKRRMFGMFCCSPARIRRIKANGRGR